MSERDFSQELDGVKQVKPTLCGFWPEQARLLAEAAVPSGASAVSDSTDLPAFCVFRQKHDAALR